MHFLVDTSDPRRINKDGTSQWILSDSFTHVLKPREIILFQTKESIKMPSNIMAMYSALNTVATQGILLINASLVEAEYDGPLSGILVNFSKENFEIAPNMDIAKISFFKIDGNIKNEKEYVYPDTNDKISNATYSTELRKTAKDIYSKTFLSINLLGEEIENKLRKKVKRDFTIGGLILVLLLAFATFEPFIYKCVWESPSFDYKDWEKKNYYQIERSENNRLFQKLQEQIDSLKKTNN